MRVRHTKIVCTLGPASSTREMLLQLARAGMDVARLNFSHGEHDTHSRNVDLLREVAEEVGRPIAIIADLQGPKLRLGEIDGTRMLETGSEVTLVTRGEAGPDELPVPLPDLSARLGEGSEVMLADGTVRLRVLAIDAQSGRIRCEVRDGGEISSRKGVNLPDVELDIPPLTDKDLLDLEFAVGLGVDYIAQSFVRSPADIELLRQHIAAHPAEDKPQIIAKIEKRVAVERLDDILAASDGVMVARGDLGVELGPADVPLVQKRIIARANELAVPVITATQMLETMTYNPDPTRAEASDVANAILDGTSAVMLSGETAVGKFPVRTVEVMDRIARTVEPAMPLPQRYFDVRHASSVPQALSDVACDIAERLDAAAIVVTTSTGRTARQVSKNRPHRPIIAATDSERTFNRLALDWGTVPVRIPHARDSDENWLMSVEAARSSGLVRDGDRIVFTAGTIVNMPGMTNMLKVEEIRTPGS